ncbi:MAG TPA: UDP-3-O-(3-hydroxymyristoyl)glucosamine N-acyltransferase, partial [Luteolibacter sp.]
VVGEDAVLGRDCHLYANVTVRERCVLGDRVILQPGAVIGSDGYGYEFSNGRHLKIDQVGIVELGDDVEIGANTTIDRARFGKTVVGEGSKIDNLVQIAHNVVIGKHCLVISQSGIAGSARLGDYVTAAAQVGVAGHVSVGDKAILGARTGVTSNLEGGITYLGNPAVPFAQEQKTRALVRRLPKLVEEVRALKKGAV